MSIPSQKFSLFKEGQKWGAVEVMGAVVCLAGSPNLWISVCRGAGPGAPISFVKRVASSSSMAEGPDSSLTGLNREASRTSSLLMVIKGANHCWSSLMALHRTPHLALDTSTQACSTLATASIFSCQMIWKLWGSEAGGRKSCEQSPCRVGGQRLFVVSRAAFWLPPATRHSVGWNNHHTPHAQHVPLH